MKNFAGSSITYYGLAREKAMSKHPRLANILTILALICMTGLALFLISDLVSFASNSDHKVVLSGLDVAQNTGAKPINAAAALKGANDSGTEENLSLQINMSQINASSSSSEAAESIIRHFAHGIVGVGLDALIAAVQDFGNQRVLGKLLPEHGHPQCHGLILPAVYVDDSAVLLGHGVVLQ